MTAVFIIAITSLIVIYDVLAALFHVRTISEQLRDWFDVQDLWVLPLAWATLFGHFWLNTARPLPMMELRTIVVVAVFLICLVLNLTIIKTTPPIWLLATAGFLLGSIVWAQGKT